MPTGVFLTVETDWLWAIGVRAVDRRERVRGTGRDCAADRHDADLQAGAGTTTTVN